MKIFVATTLVAAACIDQAAATLLLGKGLIKGKGINLGTSFTGASTFTCPGNIDNKCTPEWEAGCDFVDLMAGTVGEYKKNLFSGFTCENSFFKRGGLRGRPSLPGKVITGKCGHKRAECPSISPGPSAGIDKFSIDSFEVTTSLDARMEFHYQMPDGAICKTTHDCSSQGTTVRNTQCGGAKKVWFVFPKQAKHKGRRFCKIGIHHIRWNCKDNKLKPIQSTSRDITNTKSEGIKTETHSGKDTTATVPAEQTSVIQSTLTQTQPGDTTSMQSTLTQTQGQSTLTQTQGQSTFTQTQPGDTTSMQSTLTQIQGQSTFTQTQGQSTLTPTQPGDTTSMQSTLTQTQGQSTFTQTQGQSTLTPTQPGDTTSMQSTLTQTQGQSTFTQTQGQSTLTPTQPGDTTSMQSTLTQTQARRHDLDAEYPHPDSGSEYPHPDSGSEYLYSDSARRHDLDAEHRQSDPGRDHFLSVSYNVPDHFNHFHNEYHNYHKLCS
ncbi:hypothetical protein PLICBS_000062 [Purpureocillium lilacinum]|uniref:uncharacterized protein n=1 Tax=Purpureocillium lilacinum TaxID=33203 RepID=UPI00208CF6CC|nr:hypothetical protein PLICBS_000062 [Purpureocillium lilacinum]